MQNPTDIAAAAQPWPEAVEILNEHGKSEVVLICEHATNYIPPEYHGLGLTAADLNRHIAWDLGAAEVTRHLAGLLEAPAFLANYSRLLVDLNRPTHIPECMAVRSEATDIPGNLNLSPAERSKRVRLVFHPYHSAIASHLARRERNGRRAVIVSIHSFTPVYHGRQRPWHAGILFDRSETFAKHIIAGLQSDGTLQVGANVPYGVSRDEDYALLVHGDDLGNTAILVEIRHDLIATTATQQQWALRLAELLS